MSAALPGSASTASCWWWVRPASDRVSPFLLIAVGARRRLAVRHVVRFRDTLKFSVLQTSADDRDYPLAKAAEAYAHMMSGKHGFAWC